MRSNPGNSPTIQVIFLAASASKFQLTSGRRRRELIFTHKSDKVYEDEDDDDNINSAD